MQDCEFSERTLAFVSTLIALRNRATPEDKIVEWMIQDFAPMTHDEIGVVLNLSRQRIAQIEQSALDKVRDRPGLLPEFA